MPRERAKGAGMKSRAKDAATLKRLEARLQVPSVRSSRRQLDQLLANEFREFGSLGQIYDKHQVIDLLCSDPVPKQGRYATFQKLSVAWLADDVALITYRSVKSEGDKPRRQLANRASIWKRSDGRWRLVFHQGTPLERSRTNDG